VQGVASRAIDGSGHYAIGQIYDQQIFPDTFGWVPAYFGGMSFPNFYPPLFFWCVSLLHHTNLFSYATAFKLVASIPLLLMPAAFWTVTWFHSNKNVNIAFGAAVAGMTLYSMGEAFQPSTGLDISSSLIDGFYTQPLGFLLLLAWILVYLLPRQNSWQFALATILLALTILANFFNAMTAIGFIASVLLWDVVRWLRSSDKGLKSEASRTFLLHFASPWLSLGLVAFWVIPMLSSYQYLVTRPLIWPLSLLVSLPIWCWYFLAALGTYLWWKNSDDRLGPYLTACLAFSLGLLFSGSIAPSWFPLQVFRFFSTFNFLLCVPVGISLAFAAELYLKKRKTQGSKEIVAETQTAKSNLVRQFGTTIVVAVGLLALGLAMSTKKLTEAFVFYTPETFGAIAPVLHFAESHRDGRYLVEVRPSRIKEAPRADSLAINAYLGSQGNEAVSIVYREASPNSSFFNAQLNAFSTYRENFGISSALLDDLDFLDQPIAQHIKRLKFIGVRYLVVATPEFKDLLSKEPEISDRNDVGDWTIFTLREPTAPQIRTLPYRPALVVSDFTVKLRKQNQLDFMRLAEEQFSDAWFDVLLTRSAEVRLDHLSNLEDFGALIVDKYEYENQDRAFNLIKDFAQTHAVILISSTDSLFSRIQSSLSSFPHAYIIDRPAESPGEWIVAPEPTHHYKANAIQKLWESIKLRLDEEKIPVPLATLQALRDQKSVRLIANSPGNGSRLPVLISQTYHPKWIRDDGGPIYATTPFFTLTFVNQQTELVFKRGFYDRVGIWCSILTLLAIIGLSVIGFWRGKSKSYVTSSSH
jgi:hypothetical protein